MTNCTALVSLSPYALVPKDVSLFPWRETIPPAVDDATSDAHRFSLMSFRGRGGFRQEVLYHHGRSQETFPGGRPTTASVKNSPGLHGTYTMNGELVISLGEKGMFLDCLG